MFRTDARTHCVAGFVRANTHVWVPESSPDSPVDAMANEKKYLMMFSSEIVSAHSGVCGTSRFTENGFLFSVPVGSRPMRWCVRLRSTEHVVHVA